MSQVLRPALQWIPARRVCRCGLAQRLRGCTFYFGHSYCYCWTTSNSFRALHLLLQCPSVTVKGLFGHIALSCRELFSSLPLPQNARVVAHPLYVAMISGLCMLNEKRYTRSGTQVPLPYHENNWVFCQWDSILDGPYVMFVNATRRTCCSAGIVPDVR
ncbi:hypothetical protein K443DRAFT_227099 [Laccaria amethystina LaAM-08-1]|uniref:Uncharacterized protein n=1 Tax=Laccaria amethystina LaAM-08-1 TaxID=1095629 RepID=A0A0C9XPD0_9AGAR|nr:hypothetical protein K443DRAFT_227099 [Laccaria amethystina LaAM-08-1]